MNSLRTSKNVLKKKRWKSLSKNEKGGTNPIGLIRGTGRHATTS
jgi:hypothetical protein